MFLPNKHKKKKKKTKKKKKKIETHTLDPLGDERLLCVPFFASLALIFTTI